MTLLELMQDVCNQLGLAEPETVIGTTNKRIKQLLSLLEGDVAEELKSEVRWPQLTRTWTITLVDGQSSYDMPIDLDWTISETQWRSGSNQVIDGPYEAKEWEEMERGYSSPVVTSRFKVDGVEPTQITISPTPGADDAGQTLTFKYQTTTWIKPQTWATATVYVGNDYVFSSGRVYQTTVGGTSGATAPTHQSGSASDGSVSWTAVDGGYSRFQSDDDETLIPSYICVLGLKYAWSFSKGLPYQKHEQRYKRELTKMRTKTSGARAVILGGANQRLQTVKDAADRMY